MYAHADKPPGQTLCRNNQESNAKIAKGASLVKL